MSRSQRIPSYRLHKQSGQAVVTLTDGLGGRRDVLLGPHNTAASRAEYARVLAEWENKGRQLPRVDAAGSLSIAELCLTFLRHAEEHYCGDGDGTSEVVNFKLALRPLRELYGLLPVAEFGPLKLKAVRQHMADSQRYRVRIAFQKGQQETTLERWVWHHDFRTTKAGGSEAHWQKKWRPAELVRQEPALSRTGINARIRRLVRIFKWAVSEELVPEAIWRALTTVRGLEKGRTAVRETPPVEPVAAAVVEATLPYLLPPVRALVEVQQLTGMRPGEACGLRACEIDTSGEVWLYKPSRHKTRHKGKERVIALGPKAQAVIKPFLRLDTQAYLFSPRDALAALRARQRAGRQSRVQPSQQNRKKRKPKRQPSERYTPSAYFHAVARGVRAANTAAACADCKPLPPDERCADCRAKAIPHWHPHQLRHTHATEVRRRFGLEAAQVALGHSQADVTQLYAERNTALAAQVAKEIG